eukprot:CAMPEP_0170177284 /NCGR_PEP_ID=MMETSP0040_2-20121228/9969_1 /TAXON_ID=641309 /ORGANISM="Lotharella oceanica, Strain CCMP622" /LENGTH=93 /DNA_ID=CAMNT_0010419877 /DNA_START=63 /DNA_END=341 /DNA_ORIENTATION=-
MTEGDAASNGMDLLCSSDAPAASSQMGHACARFTIDRGIFLFRAVPVCTLCHRLDLVACICASYRRTGLAIFKPLDWHREHSALCPRSSAEPR